MHANLSPTRHALPSFMRRICTLLLLAATFCVPTICALAEPSTGPAQTLPKPIEIKVVVIAMFEQGNDTGDVPGEYQYWVERQHLDTVLPFPQGYHDLRLNPQTGVLGILTGVATARAAASVMALGLDPRFDLTHAYFGVAGIGGMNPAVGSLASAVWSDWIVDADQAYEIDAREIPRATPEERKVWTTGYIPLGKSVPYEKPRAPRFGDDGNIYPPQHILRNLGLQPHQKHRSSPTLPSAQSPRCLQFEAAEPR